MNRAFTNLLCPNIEATAAFYEQVLGMTRHYASDWFIILTHTSLPGYEFGLIDRGHDSVPTDGTATSPTGVLLTFVVDALAPVRTAAERLGAEIVEVPRAMPYGQTRMVLRDPAGALVDVSCPTT